MAVNLKSSFNLFPIIIIDFISIDVLAILKTAAKFNCTFYIPLIIIFKNQTIQGISKKRNPRIKYKFKRTKT